MFRITDKVFVKAIQRLKRIYLYLMLSKLALSNDLISIAGGDNEYNEFASENPALFTNRLFLCGYESRRYRAG